MYFFGLSAAGYTCLSVVLVSQIKFTKKKALLPIAYDLFTSFKTVFFGPVFMCYPVKES